MEETKESGTKVASASSQHHPTSAASSHHPSTEQQAQMEGSQAANGAYIKDGATLRRLTGVDLAVTCPSPLTAVGMLGGLERLTAACRGETRRLQVTTSL